MSMENIRDIDGHKLCEADPLRGILIWCAGKTERIEIYLPVGGEVSFSREKSYTYIRRETPSQFRVKRYRQDTG